MGYKKLLTNVVVGGVCFVNWSFANTASRELQIPHLPKQSEPFADDDDANNDFPKSIIFVEGALVPSHTADDYINGYSNDSLNLKKRTALTLDDKLTILEAELGNDKCSLRYASMNCDHVSHNLIKI
jgi:hypothetical protein